jgi:hypothetical protein
LQQELCEAKIYWSNSCEKQRIIEARTGQSKASLEQELGREKVYWSKSWVEQ